MRVTIKVIGNTWASLYAADDPKACGYVGQDICALKPLPRFRASFDGATVQEIRFLNSHQARAEFSNGILVEFFGYRGTWTIVKLVVPFNPG